MAPESEPGPQLPPGLSPAEEARWWDEHRDYWDTVQTRDERVGPSRVRAKKRAKLRLPVEMAEALKGPDVSL